MERGATPAGTGIRFAVAAAEAGERLDVIVTRHLPDLSRARVQRLIREGHVTLAGKATKPGEQVAAGLEVDVRVPETTNVRISGEALPLSVLHEDEDMVVIDKAAGMVVHPGAGHGTGTLVNALLHHVGGLSGIGGVARPGIVHRLDKGTSGVIVIAKHDAAHLALSRQFHDRSVRKEYQALVWGCPRPGAVFDAPIGRDPANRKKMSTRAPRGRRAVTTVISVEPLGDVSLVGVRISTGRTHQIRVHLGAAGHPVVGDALYGGVRRHLSNALAPVARLGRPFLHAGLLAFVHPRTNREVSFTAPLPTDLTDVLEALRRRLAPGTDPGGRSHETR